MRDLMWAMGTGKGPPGINRSSLSLTTTWTDASCSVIVMPWAQMTNQGLLYLVLSLKFIDLTDKPLKLPKIIGPRDGVRSRCRIYTKCTGGSPPLKSIAKY